MRETKYIGEKSVFESEKCSLSSPECRVKSDFVTPTKYWPENEQAKQELIKAYKENLQ